MLTNNQISHTGQDPEPAARLAKLVLVLAIVIPIYIGYKMIPKESYVETTGEVDNVEDVVESKTEELEIPAKEVVIGERLGAIIVGSFPGFTVERFMGQCNQTHINYLTFKKDTSEIVFGLHALNPFECLATDNFVDPDGISRSGNYFYNRETASFYNDYGAGRLQISGQSVVVGGKSVVMYPLKYTSYEGYFIPLVEHDQSLVIALTEDSALAVKTITIDKVLEKISIGIIK